MNRNRNTVAAGVLIGAIFIGASTYDYVKIRRVERQKRAIIDAWEQDISNVIIKIRDEQLAYIESPDFNIPDFWERFQENKTFVSMLINDRPSIDI